MHFPHLFSPAKIGSCVLKNRIIMALYPTKYAFDSKVNPKMLAFYRARAGGGAGLIVLDCPCLDYPRAYKGGQELRIDQPEYEQTVRELIAAVHEGGAKAFMHLTYPKERNFTHEVKGAKKKGAAWELPLANNMSLAEADEVLGLMARGAARAREIGYDGVEIQASYGGLIAQLLSPLLNRRTDELGGSLANRARFLTGLIRRVKQEAGADYPVMVKLVCHEFAEGGLQPHEACEIGMLAAKAGADGLVANGGNKATKFLTIPGHDLPPAPLLDLAVQLKRSVAVPVVAIGKISSPGLAEKIVASGSADFTAMARALVADPELPAKALAGRLEDIRGCVYCLEDCADKGVAGIGRCCAVNPFAGQEYRWQITPAPKKKQVLVIGGGPAGIQAATIASQRGHAVELWECDHQLGGQLKLAHLAPYKAEMAEALRYLRYRIGTSAVLVRTGEPVTVDSIITRAPDAVIVACGSSPGMVDIPGIASKQVIHARQLYEQSLPIGEKIVIVGGGELGCETADWLAAQNRRITVVEILPEPLTKMKKLPKARLLARLAEKGVELLTASRVTAIEPGTVQLITADGKKSSRPADTVILAISARPENRLIQELQDRIGQVVAVGDAAAPGNLGAALRSATEAALTI